MNKRCSTYDDFMDTQPPQSKTELKLQLRTANELNAQLKEIVEAEREQSRILSERYNEYRRRFREEERYEILFQAEQKKAANLEEKLKESERDRLEAQNNIDNCNERTISAEADVAERNKTIQRYQFLLRELKGYLSSAEPHIAIANISRAIQRGLDLK